ncbi:RagB/SusD family nutrient uptake outer membrane protein [Sphingobacterium tabacisoli]|uniref:RagB/SusD family nutrient uptake outer membrane protein n=1 Tax=Sphingobacterium tabacisoli TaxID=2044855 RepID=A0ABW5L8T1_9SPHI|nr:RagB/SusD family nutrient uptake outer membrane protein [Sphingobacterium tabacisoli]
MKTNKIIYAIIGAVCLVSTSCNDYLNILPTGKKIPTSYSDFEALLRDESGVHSVPVRQASMLLNDFFVSASTLSFERLSEVNYNWKESDNRIVFNNADESTYYQGYASISTCNLLIEYAPNMTDATELQKNQLVATSKVIRALNYYTLANYYAATYDVGTAETLKSVPLIESANIEAPHKQVTIQELYDFMISDIEQALPTLSNQGLTVLHPGKGAAHTLLARIYLQMENYPKALEHAQKALAIKNELYDWNAYYESEKARLENPTLYTRKLTPLNHNYVETYYFRHGTSPNFPSSETSVRVDRAARFETRDSKFASRWKLRTVGNDTYYYSMMTGYYNTHGLTTAEAYLIEAECLARTNKVSDAMNVLNKVRKTRILPDAYQDLSASTIVDAVKLIQRTKQNEFIQSIVPFADLRRLNKDPQYATTLTKTENGAQLSLSPSSHLWIMPFPQGAIENPGNGTIEQNVNK